MTVENTSKGQLKDEKPISVFQLYRYATCLDIVFILLGIVASCISGVSTPLLSILLADVTGAVITYTTNITTDSNNTQFYKDELSETIKMFTINSSILGLICIVGIYISSASFSYSGLRQGKTIRCLYMKHILNQDISWYDTHGTGDFTSRIAEDLPKIEESFGDKCSSLIYYLATCISAIILAFLRGWKLASICILYFPISLISMQLVSWLTTKFVRNEMEAYASAGCIAEEVLSAIKTVVAFGGQKKETERYEDQLIVAKENNINRVLLVATNNAIYWLLAFAFYSLSFYFGLAFILDERHLPEQERTYTSGNMLSIFFNILLATLNLGLCAPYFQIFSIACVAATNIYSVMDLKPVINDSKGHGRKLPKLRGNIIFDNVRFLYPSRSDVQVLKSINFNISAGETVAFVGSSGSGKSTCINLIQRFYDPAFGNIFIDGINLKSLDLEWIRSRIGVVGQEPALFAMKIAENIKLGNPSATESDIERAAIRANAHSFIIKFPRGYDTLVGEKGTQLSGGQKQRIAIARALVKNPSILLLDEATSALDTHSEFQVQNTIDSITNECTTIIVAHRLSTVRNANRILVFSDGKIVEQGSHEALMSSKGVYYYLVSAQTSVGLDTEDITRNQGFDKDEYEEIEEEGDLEQISLKQTCEEMCVQDKHLQSPLGTILTLNKPEYCHIILGCISALIFGATLPLYAVIFGDIIGILSDPDDDFVRSMGNQFSLYFLILAIIVAVSSFLQLYLFGIAGEELTSRIRRLLFEKILQQEIGWFDKKENGVGAICAKLSSDASSIQGAAAQPIGTVLNSLGTILVATGVSFYYEWRLTLVVLATTPLVFAGIYLEQKILNQDSTSSSSLAKATNLAVEALGSIRTVCSLGCEYFLHERYQAILEPRYRRAKIHLHVTAIVFAFSRSLFAICYAIAVYYGGILITRNNLSSNKVFKISEALIVGAWCIGNAVAYSPNLRKGLLAAADITKILKRIPQIRDPEKAIEWRNGNIKLSKISFKYPTRGNVEVLADLDLAVFQGKTVGLVGASGCGKSTIIQLIQRFYDPLSGTITIDRTNINNMKLGALRPHLGVVSQEPNLFDRTIAENIAYGDNQRYVTMEEIIEAAKKANIHNFITSLRLGYDTRVGEKGVQISGGQKQRIAVARALIRNPQVLILDEATSALDSESEKIIHRALEKQGRTCITIAHRLTTLQGADVICVLNKGFIQEMGTHDDLINSKGLYFKMYMMQVHGA